MEQLSSYGVSFLNLTEAPVVLNCMVLQNLYGFHGEITGELTNAYISAAKPEVIKLLTSSDLFGNPNHF